MSLQMVRGRRTAQLYAHIAARKVRNGCEVFPERLALIDFVGGTGKHAMHGARGARGRAFAVCGPEELSVLLTSGRTGRRFCSAACCVRSAHRQRLPPPAVMRHGVTRGPQRNGFR
ncbi:MAG: hypothetical protein D6725_05685 [Planctomycetota bacterium]|nr:MAG: hypothetical protein D6725_05685 [Planctomycetota bacterium]